MNYPAFKLEAVLKQQLPPNTPVINSDEFEYYLWVHVPQIFARDFVLYELTEMSEPPKSISLSMFCFHDNHRPWYRIISEKLNRTPGLHIYRMSFVNRFNNDVTSLFFGYVVQCDHPPKPYDYMHGERKCGCCQ